MYTANDVGETPGTPKKTEEQKEAIAAQWNAEVAKKPAEFLASLRVVRNELLAECDWTQVSDVTLDNKAAWATYRQALRDLPANTVDPENPTWPTKP